MKKIIFYLLIFIFLIQLYRPEKNISTSPSKDHISAVVFTPIEIQNVLKQSCYDCHSNHTNYLWYHEIAPFSWGVALHIKDGKKHLNFDTFAQYNERVRNHTLAEINKVVSDGEMPMKAYVLFHPKSRLNAQDIIKIKNWTEGVALAQKK